MDRGGCGVVVVQRQYRESDRHEFQTHRDTPSRRAGCCLGLKHGLTGRPVAGAARLPRIGDYGIAGELTLKQTLDPSRNLAKLPTARIAPASRPERISWPPAVRTPSRTTRRSIRSPTIRNTKCASPSAMIASGGIMTRCVRDAARNGGG